MKYLIRHIPRAGLLLALAQLFCPRLNAANVQVTISGFAFHPDSVTINQGDSITWKNLDGIVHTTTSGVAPDPDGRWNSGSLGLNQTFTQSFPAAGTFSYFCIPHFSSMHGSVIVKAATIQPPVVTITSPANNSTFTGPTNLALSATATVTGSTISGVEFFDGQTSLGSDSSQPYSINATLQVGTHSITAKATAANGGNTVSTPVTIVVNSAATPPVVSITSPTNNATFTGPTNLTIAADATVDGSTIDKVEFFDGAVLLDTANGNPFSITSNFQIGTHSITAKATAANGATATSAAVNITVKSAGTRIDDPFPPLSKSDLTVELQTVMDGLISPLGLAAPDDGSNRLFVFDQVGLIYVLTNGIAADAPLLDVRQRLVPLMPGYDERGLLGVATHPNFAQNPFIYTYTSEPNGLMADFMIMDGLGTNNHQSVIAEWKISSTNPNQLDPNSRREILRIDEPEFNHNGGTMHFGPDGMLYASLGDGGNADDQGFGHLPGGNAQNLGRVLGKILRIDVDGRTSPNHQYSVPADNPFVGSNVQALGEIYAYGFRNPYSWSFDRLTGELYVGDVGQNSVEELDRVFKGGNYGWPIKEGSFYFDPAGDDPGFITTLPVRDVPADLADPIAEYDHTEGIAIVGGYKYHGTQLPNLIDRYVTADLGSFGGPTGRLFVLDRSDFREIRIGTEGRPLGIFVKGFGEDPAGELYVFGSTNLGPSGTSGKMLKIVAPSNSLAAAIQRTTNGVSLGWTGGVGPFLVEQKGNLNNSFWKSVMGTAQRSLALQASATNNAFFRVTDMAGNPATAFTVYMTAAAARPTTNTSTGTGSGTLTLEGNTLHFDIHYTGLTGPATLAHIHGPATAAQAAGIIIDLMPFNGGTFGTNGTLSGSVTVTPEQKAMILSGQTYVNVHTAANPSGEIRGQIAPMVFMAELDGASERPTPIDTAGNGSAILFLVGNQLTFNVTYRDLSTAATLAHIHGPATEDVPAGIMVNLVPFNGGSFGTNGLLSGSVSLAPDQLAALVDNLTYLNVHTSKNPGGEIRGQIFPHTGAIPLSASLSGGAEQLPDVTGSGTGLFALEGHTLHFEIYYTGLSGPAVAAHIHGPAKASEQAGVLISLIPFNGGAFGTNGTLSGSVALTDDQLATILEGRTYVNIHSAAHPNGEIRGQVIPSILDTVLLGASERPVAVQTAGRGSGTFLVAGNKLTVSETYCGLSAPATAAHIHAPAPPSDAAGVAVDFSSLNTEGFGTNGAFAGTLTLTPDLLGALGDGLIYMNIHTSTNKSGEIRGQITR